MIRKRAIEYIVAIILVLAIAGLAVYYTGAPSPVSSTTTISPITTIGTGNVTLTPACQSSGNCTIWACPRNSRFNSSTSMCLWNYTPYSIPSSSQSCSNGLCVSSPLVLQSGVQRQLNLTIQDVSVFGGSVYANGTCGTAAFRTASIALQASGSAELNVTEYLIVNPSLSSESLNCAVNLHSTRTSYSASISFSAFLTASCPGGAIARNGTTCKVIVTQGTNPCADGFLYSQSNGLCEPKPLFCSAGYTVDPGVPYRCVLVNACPSGYNFTLSNGSALCSKG